MVPVPKKQRVPLSAKNARGVLLACHSGKIYSRIASTKTQHLLPEAAEARQSGGVKGGSTAAPQIVLSLFIKKVHKEQKCAAVLITDIKTAFYSVFAEVALGSLLPTGTRERRLLAQDTQDRIKFCVCCRDPGDCLFPVCSVAIPATDPMCLCGLAALVSREVVWLEMGRDGFQTQKKKSWVSGQKEFWQMRSRLMADMNGFANSVRRPICGRGGFAAAVGTTSPRVCKESISRRCTRRIKNGTPVLLPRVAEKNGRPQGQQEEIKRLRAQFELLSKQRKAVKSLEESSESARRGSDLDEGSRMEVEEEVQSKKKLDEQRRNLQRQMRDIDKLTFLKPAVREAEKEKFVCLLQEVERKRTDLLSEHQKMQKRS